MKKIFPVYYCPPISWFSALKGETDVMFEVHQHYRKQQYFNRMRIKGPNGVQALSIPVEKARDHTPLVERRIAYAQDWQKNHWKSLEAAYRSSPYFEYYEDQIEGFYTRKFESLAGYNLEWLRVIFGLLQMEVKWELSEKYLDPEHYAEDFRHVFDARKGISPEGFEAKTYTQVFPGWDPDLSILDLLFNEGPAARTLL